MDHWQSYRWQIDADVKGQRLDKVLPQYHHDWSRVRVQEWIKEGWVQVDGIAKKGNYRLKEGEWIEIQVPPILPLEIEAESIPLDIRYEDQDVLVVNKPRGMVVHPGAGNHSGTLVNALLAYCREELSGIGGVARPGIVHRIDKDTSGLLVVAKNDRAHQSLVEQLKEHSLDRIYTAIVYGLISHQQGTIDAPIGRDTHFRQRMSVTHVNGKRAVTHFSVIKRLQDSTIIQCRLETGRTHQIRVHMTYIGYPIIGDQVYGPKKAEYPIIGQALHAQTIGFIHPRTGERVQVDSELPEDINKVIGCLSPDE